MPLRQNSIWPPAKIKIIIKSLLNPVLVNLNKKTIEEEVSNFVLKSWVNLLEKESNMVPPKIKLFLRFLAALLTD